MKLKKFFAGVLAAAMMLTVGATVAFATTPEYTTTPDNVDLGIMKNYKVEKGTAPKENFKFYVTYVPEKSKPYTTAYTGYDGTYKQPEASKTAIASFKSDMDTKAENYQESLGIKISDFSLPEGPGKYCFKITENVPTNKTPGVTYDETTRYLVITVAHNDDYTGYVYYAQLFDDSYTPGTSIKNGQSAGVKVLGSNAFTNTYTANNVVISKDIKGGLGDLAAKFNFKVKLTVADTKNANQYVGAKVVHSDDTAVTVGTVWSISAKDSEDGWYDVKLGRNDQLELENLPEGVIVTVKETDGNEYTVSQNPSDISSKNANTSYAKIGTFTENTATVNATVGAVNGSIGFVNTKEGTPDMGVVLDNAPYIAMLAIVAIGGVALMLNKRRRDEE